MKISLKKMTAGIGAFAMLAFSFATVLAPTALAATDYNITNGANAAQGDNVPAMLIGSDDSIFTVVVNILLYVIGAISVIMLIVGGIRYTISNGDSSQVTSAKNTILYAIVGLIIAFLAYAIVNWVLTGLGNAA